MAQDLDRFLLYRNGRWHYNRRVPKQYHHVESRRHIRGSLKTKSLDIARMRRDAMEQADDEFWMALSIEVIENGGVSEATRAVQDNLYKAAAARALVYGFVYKPVKQLVAETPVAQIVERVDVLARERDTETGSLPKLETYALLGGVRKPKDEAMTVSQAFDLYVEKIAFDAQFKKSPAQRNSWEKAKRTSTNYFIEAIGDIPLRDINRKHVLTYRDWWAQRLIEGDDKGVKPTPYTANRHIGNMRSLFREYFEYKGEEERPNPFRKISFKEDKGKRKRPPFETKYLQEKFLVPGLFDNLNEDLRRIVFVLIETGARPSEICNLRPENIHLDVDVPFISIKEKANREVKAADSNRDIPLVGVALQAMRLSPKGFPRYFDKETSFSAMANKAFKQRKLFPTPNHKVYSLRHTFEDRMIEAETDYALRCLLMGHKNDRPAYGSGGSMEYRREQIMKFAYRYPRQIFDAEASAADLSSDPLAI